MNYFDKCDIWVNSDCTEILDFASRNKVSVYKRPASLADDYTATLDVLKDNLAYFKKNKITTDAIILLQPTSPLRQKDLLKECISVFEKSKRNSLPVVVEEKI